MTLPFQNSVIAVFQHTWCYSKHMHRVVRESWSFAHTQHLLSTTLSPLLQCFEGSLYSWNWALFLFSGSPNFWSITISGGNGVKFARTPPQQNKEMGASCCGATFLRDEWLHSTSSWGKKTIGIYWGNISRHQLKGSFKWTVTLSLTARTMLICRSGHHKTLILTLMKVSLIKKTKQTKHMILKLHKWK